MSVLQPAHALSVQLPPGESTAAGIELRAQLSELGALGDSAGASVSGKAGRRCSGKGVRGCSCAVLSLMLFPIGMCIVIVHILTHVGTQRFLDMDDSESRAYTDWNLTIETLMFNTWWPGCGLVMNMSEFEAGCSEPCYSADLMLEMQTFNRANPGMVVNFSSREVEGIPTAKLAAWWLPPPPHARDRRWWGWLPALWNAPPPVVVLQHGFMRNSNYYTQQMAAFMLRRMGFGVLVNNFRDHGYSDDSGTGTYQWGDAYPFDLLGAWDYAVSDPDGKLAGARRPAHVGLMGFSKGAFMAINAFGLEPRVPGVWADAPPFTPQVVFKHGAEEMMSVVGLRPIAPLVLDNVWDNIVDRAVERGISLNRHLPQSTLPLGNNTRRPIHINANEDDDVVPIREMESLLVFLQGLEEKYNTTSWRTSGTCHGRSHCVDHLTHHDEYDKRLCGFWSHVFGVGAEDRCSRK